MVRLVRPHQYTKNLLIFAAPGAAGRLDEGPVLFRTLIAFVLFCAVSSAGYVANDLADAEVDRLHPRKRHRPIASREVMPATARRLIAVLLVGSAIAAPFLGPSFALTLLAYALLTFAYSKLLKQVPWIELAIVSAGFLLRAVAGGAATDTQLSGWFLGVVSAGALFVITGKRLGELLTLGQDTPSRPVLAHYSATTLRALAVVAALVAIGAYTAWAVSDASNQTGDDSGDLALKLTTIPFMVAIVRYLVLSWRGKGEAPDIIVLRDPVMLFTGIAWIGLYAIGLYA